MQNPASSRQPRTLAHKALQFVAALAAVLAVPALYVAVVGVSIDASELRDDIAGRLSERLGREVRFDGPLQLELSARPKIMAGGLHIANAPGYTGAEFARLGEARLALDLWALLRLRLEVEELSGSDVRFRLQMDRRGVGNWTFSPSAAPARAGQAPAAKGRGKGFAELLSVLDIQRVSLDNLKVEFIGSNGKSHFFELQALTARFPAGRPLALSLEGTVERTYPYRLELTGGTIADLGRLNKPWPFALTLGFMNSQLALDGKVSRSGGVINFGLGTGNLAEFERLLQTRLPAVGAAGFSGVITYAPGSLALDNLNGTMGKTALNGSLHVKSGAERPRIEGELTLPVLDLRPFLTGRSTAQEEPPPKSLADVYRELSAATFSLKDLNGADADLTLRVGQWLSLPGSVHDATLNVKLEQGKLSMPMQATVGGVVLSGRAAVDARSRTPHFALVLRTSKAGSGNLAGLLVGVPDVQGQLGRLVLNIAARGDSGAELMRTLDVKLEVGHGILSYGNGAGQRPVQLALDDLTLALPAGRDLQGDAHGSLLDKTFTATLHGGSLTAIMQQAHVPIDFQLQAGSARAEVHAMLLPPSEESGSNMTVDISAPHSGEIAAWLGLRPGADVPVSVRGNFHTASDGWHLAGFAAQLGHSALSADVQRTYAERKWLTRLQLTSDLIDLAELQSLLPEAGNKTAPAVASQAVNLVDIPILPNGVRLSDADIVVRVKRIIGTVPLAVRDLRFDGRIRHGMMSPSPFGVNVAGADFNGAILLDFRTQQPHAVLWLAAGALNIGNVLGKLGIAQNVDAGIEHLRMQLDMHSSRLGEMAAQSEVSVEFEGGHLALHGSSGGRGLRVAIHNGVLRSSPGAPVYLDLDGTLDGAPVAIGIQTATAADLVNPELPIPFKFNASTAGAAIQLSGDMDRPFRKKDLELQLEMSGTRLDALDTLARTSLPPWGPWSVSGKFHMTATGYEVPSLLLQVGSSELTGRGNVDTGAVPARVDVALTAPSIQLDDFRLGDWSPEKARGAEKKASTEEKKVGEAETRVEKMLSVEVLRRQNAYLTVNVDQVLSGKDTLGAGHLTAQLENGRAEIGPVVVNTPGGSALLRLDYEPNEKDVAANLVAEVKRFDYGILARRIDPKSEMQGIFSLDVDVSARAQSLSEILRQGNGHIDFAVWPQNLKSGLLDIWAVNVLMALLPKVDSSSESKVNCAIGRFELKDGRMSEKTILIDTSRMRVTGKGGADFAAGKINLYLRPRAKTPQFLSLAVPIEVTGSFTDFHVGVRPLDVAGSVAQLATSVVWVPLESLFGKKVPADGSDVCSQTEFK